MNKRLWVFVGLSVVAAYLTATVSSAFIGFPKKVFNMIDSNSTMETIRGKKLRVTNIQNESSSVTFFFVHGLGGEIEQFYEQIEYFKNHGSVVAVDFVGHGRSPQSEKDTDYNRDEIVEDLNEILRKFAKKDSKLVIIGHSYGTCLSTKLYLTYPQNISALVLISTLKEWQKKNDMLLTIPRWVFEAYRIVGRIGGINSMSVNSFVNKNAPVDVKRRQLALSMNNKSDTIIKTVKGLKVLTDEEWQNVTIPFLLIHSKEDTITPLEPAQSVLSNNHCAGIESFDGCGHNLMMEKPNEINDSIENFLKRISLFS